MLHILNYNAKTFSIFNHKNIAYVLLYSDTCCLIVHFYLIKGFVINTLLFLCVFLVSFSLRWVFDCIISKRTFFRVHIVILFRSRPYSCLLSSVEKDRTGLLASNQRGKADITYISVWLNLDNMATQIVK